jgi:hypothetical protein
MILLAQALFLGNAACAPCHARIFETYSRTPMAQSSGRLPAALPAGEFRHAASGVAYRIDTNGTVMLEQAGRRAIRRFTYFIGSGAAGRSFLESRDGFLFQAPITWYTQAGRWDVSPGYENDRISRWSRAIEPSCLYCHASQTAHIDHTQNRYRDPPFTAGISCERCHGPGGEHARGRGGMVNPSKLPAAQRDAVCAQCHLSGEARSERAGRSVTTFRPGHDLRDYVAYFVYDNRQAALKATSHFEKMYGSRCKTASGDRLWCGSCHDPHTVPAPAERASWYRGKCLGCHEPETCVRGLDCVSCHMPRDRVVDGGHGVLTDHSIPRQLRRVELEPTSAWRLVGFSPADSGARELGLAYAELFLRTRDRRQRDEAFRLLQTVPPDVTVELRLADLYQRGGQLPRAEHLYRSVLKQNGNNLVALVNLAGIVASRGGSGLQEAALMWHRALEQNPCLEEALINLITVVRALGDASALNALEKARGKCAGL